MIHIQLYHYIVFQYTSSHGSNERLSSFIPLHTLNSLSLSFLICFVALLHGTLPIGLNISCTCPCSANFGKCMLFQQIIPYNTSCRHCSINVSLVDDKECTTGTGRTRQQKPLSSSKYLLFLAHHLPSLIITAIIMRQNLIIYPPRLCKPSHARSQVTVCGS